MPSASDGEEDLPNEPLSSFATQPSPIRDRPLLLPCNHRLRHLSGISLRNLSSQNPSLKSANATQQSEEPNDAECRPLGRRRRSTRSGPPPPMRQRGDVLFAIHIPAEDEPVYVSEVVHQSMNPDFLGFDFNPQGPGITRRDEIIVKVWCDFGTGWILLLEVEVVLAGLTFVGKTLDTFRHPLPQNCILFYLSDGVYTSFWDSTPPPTPPPLPASRPASQTTSSYDTLLKLTNLSTCIEDSNSTTASVRSHLTTLLITTPSLPLSRAVSERRTRLSTLRTYLETESRRLSSSRRRLESLQTSLAARRAAIASGRTAQRTSETYLTSARSGLIRCRRDLVTTHESAAAQRRRIISTLFDIFPITAIPESPLEFTIRSLPLRTPITEPDTRAEAEVQAATLGYVAQIVYLLGFYLSVPLRYPVRACGSRSYVLDSVSVIQGPRTFPLWSKGEVWYRTEYAVFLMNKDLEQLLARVGVTAVDLRQTLANLLTLALVVGGGGGKGLVAVNGGGSGGGHS